MILEAGWYWAADLLQANGARVHLAHPLGNNWGNRRVKNDERDAADLADLLHLGRLAEAWIAPPEARASCGSCCAPGPSWWRCAQASRPRCMRCWPKKACGCR